MDMMKRVLLLTALLLAVVAGCTKKDPPSPYHKDIFRCKVNGEEWVATCPSDGLFGCQPIDCQYYWKDTKGFEIGAKRRTHDNSVYNSLGLYKLQSEIGDNVLTYTSSTYSDFNNSTGCKVYSLDTTSIRRLTIIEADTVKYLIKGTFEFTVFNKCMDTLRFTEGEFHVNFRY